MSKRNQLTGQLQMHLLDKSVCQSETLCTIIDEYQLSSN